MSGVGWSNNCITFFPICGPYFNGRVQRELFELTKTLIGLSWWFSGKEFACNTGDLSSIPGSGRSPGEANGNPLQYSCLGNSMDRGAWWATVHAVTESDTTEVTWHTQCMYVNSNLPVHPTLPCACLHVHSLCLHLYSCPANRFISTIFLDSTYMRV